MRNISITEPARDIIPFAPACHSENRVYSSLRANYVWKKTCKILDKSLKAGQDGNV